MNTNKEYSSPNYLLNGNSTTLYPVAQEGANDLPTTVNKGRTPNYIIKGLNITVSDNKKLIPLFEGRFQQFEIRNKGTNLDNPEAIIKLLNSRSRSFLKILESLVLPVKNINRNINNYSNQGKLNLNSGNITHPKKLVNLTKDLNYSHLKGLTPSFHPSGSIVTDLEQDENLRSGRTIASGRIKGAEGAQTVKSDILTTKINSLTQLLKNNKLTMPFNLLKPLMKINGVPAVSNLENTTTDSIRKNKYLELFMPFSSINPYQQNIQFNFNASNNKKRPMHNLVDILESAFRAMSCLISKPVYTETPDKININLFFFLVKSASALKQIKTGDLLRGSSGPGRVVTSYQGIEIKNVTQPSELSERYGYGAGKENNLQKESILGRDQGSINSLKGRVHTQINVQKLNLLCSILSRIFKKQVELDVTRLHLPYFDENILVKGIGIMSKEVNVRNIFNIIFRKTKISTRHKNPLKSAYSRTGGVNSYLTGIKIRIGGRLMTQRVIPRLTTRVIQKGAITRGKINYINSSRVTLKNKRGSHSITSTISHLI